MEPSERRGRNFLSLALTATDQSSSTTNLPTISTSNINNATTTITSVDQPILEIQSPKTPTLSRKLKAVSLDSDPPPAQSTNLEVSRDVFSMPNTPKRQIKHKLSCEFDSNLNKLTAPTSSNLKKFASNSSISGSQTLKTLPEVMTLHDFSPEKVAVEPSVVKVKTKGLLERRGSNASLTIDLGGAVEKTPLTRLNAAKSVSNLNLTSFGSPTDKCLCHGVKTPGERRRSQEACGNCTIYESVPSKGGKVNCCSCAVKCRRKSLSNENLYVPPCGGFVRGGVGCGRGGCGRGRGTPPPPGGSSGCDSSSAPCGGIACGSCVGGIGGIGSSGLIRGGYRKAYYPRQPDLNNTLSDDFKVHLQNVEYLQTAGNVLSVEDLDKACEIARVPKLHSEFWEVPLNLQEKCYVSGSQSRNRYKGVLPNEHSRVHLPGEHSYIHANYIKGPDYTDTAYIATQGPMTHTCRDFWDMVWHTNCTCIVMLTGLVEKGRSKCELYFPLGKRTADTSTKSFFYVKTTRERDKFSFGNQRFEEEDTVEFEELNEIVFGEYTVRYVDQEALDECIIRHLELSRGGQSRNVRHYWFPNWQDHKMANPEQLLKMAAHILKLDVSERIGRDLGEPHKGSGSRGGGERRKSEGKVGPNPPIVVHCSAGIGRTGCFLAILNGIQQLRKGGSVDVLAILCSLRLNRGGMVQTAEQYELIHRVLNLYTGMASNS